MEPELSKSTKGLVEKHLTLSAGEFEKLMADTAAHQHLVESQLQEREENFGLSWPGKKLSQQQATSPPSGVFIECREESANWENTENIFIEGDNLDALKILQQDFYGKIKTIYIDPPYNTGNNGFTYADNFSEKPKLRLQKNDIRRRNGSEQNEFLHAGWLSMMYPRLVLARKLLKDNGVIFISIDDNEVAHLKLIMDEIFGHENYIDIFCWTKSETPANLSKKSKKVVEYILCYQKTKTSEKFKGIRKKTISSNGLLNQSNRVNTLIFPSNIVRTNMPDQVIKNGVYGTDKYHIELLEKTEVKNGRFVLPVILKAKFKWTQPKLDLEISKGTLLNIPTLRFSPSYERMEYDAEVPPNLINSKVGVETNETAGNDLANLFGAKVFDFPKPPSLIKYLLGFSDDQDGIVLDFFAGSGSTAQAVLEMNAEDKGNRKFICVQIGEKTPVNSVARKFGFDTISQITRKRIELALQNLSPSKVLSGSSRKSKQGFRFYELTN
ncbi:MAG: site-specific DNA-methyltransferase [Ginsengibacter sp.]